ncbi:hypothetical protein HKBW3S44_00588 [Candidatus Hakubella thermalkaliphila]|uniref:HEPN domain-containing protein n=1 Tax=Candidatus Hakubella thermalkaliphila TaxID=2754717 RepID=A0A6V8PX84_9ACTN|nr:HEPN domain-containing protein [Candidatus Hakubella thermalkaliphila]GFP22650.1 hypothetical protein HKBW3S09_00118 [Candidatus Hakubella thermalkaliphila]GFP29550.1 hypothetical protein HKBW3S34_00470 [Candidatus Hakubella thermalkaliphila]GFP36907.1 hypothetical protein HKBW3S44_00588 [Candidatus Hakubella thermalkaliphila]GFP38544.1 hypothetical protein HKBW3S47_00245 [Candidatus Hakubella thermalkaliphila]
MAITLEKKRKALEEFTKKILSSKVKDKVAKIVLFGSVGKNMANADSDVDLLVFGTSNLAEISEACAQASLETAIELKESVEPLIYCLDDLRFSPSYFLYSALKDGEEVFTMKEEESKKKEALNYQLLAQEYLEGAELNLENELYRLAVDAAYNAAELCAKGLLLLKLSDIPTSHGGIIGMFGELFVKTEVVPNQIGRGLNRNLQLRNKARYDFHALITKEDAEKAIDLAKKLVAIFRESYNYPIEN